MSDTVGSGLPRLAYVYHPRSFPTLSLVDAAAGVCELAWVVDTTQDEVAPMTRLLRRFGEVVDIAGQTVRDAAAAIGAVGPDGLLSLADDSLRWTADVAAALGVPFHTPEVALRLTDKFAQREALRAHGLISPRSWVLEADATDETLEQLREASAFPAVLKPRHGEASRDTVPVGSFDELAATWRAHRAGGLARSFVLEEYIADAPGTPAGEGFAGYVSVESMVVDSHVTHFAVNGRMPPAEPFRETGFFVPSALEGAVERAVLDVARDAALALGIERGCLHTEVKLTPDGPVVIEVNGRIGGGVPELLSAVTDVPILSIAMRLALGETVHRDEMPPCDGLAFLFYVQAPPWMRTVTAVDGLDELGALPEVREIELNRAPGQSVDWREGNHGNVATVFGVTSDHDALRRTYARVGELVRIDGV